MRSTGSAADTFIVGGADTRCVYLDRTGCLQGFTITGGRVSETDTGDAGRGAGVMCSQQNANRAVTDCVISNNTGYAGSASYKCSLYRCRVADNVFNKSKGAVISSYLVSSFLTREQNVNYIIQSNCKLYNCTLDSSSSQFLQFTSTDNCFYNCLLRNCYIIRPYNVTHLFYGNVLSGSTTYTNVCDKDKTTENGYSCTNVNFTLASRKLLDARPCQGVALEGLGVDFTYGDAWQYQCGDIDGRPLVVTAGRPMPGAAQAYAEAVYVTNLFGAVTVEGGENTTGWVSLANGLSATVTATEAETRPFLGFRVDGVLSDHSRTSLVLDATYAGKTVEVVYTTDWYVDAENGNDAADGMTPETARRTLEKIMAVNLKKGDTVHAAPGTYDSGSMTNGTYFYYRADGVCDLPNRVVVPGGVRLVADEGPERTFIVGAAATDQTRSLGLGPGAIRCVTLLDTAVISGFTLTGGHTLDLGDVPKCDNDRDDDCFGGGVLGMNGMGLVDDCIISNNAAYNGGAVVYATVRRCRIFNCDATANAAATWVCYHEGSCIDHFRTDTSILNYYRSFDSSTAGPDLRDAAGNPKSAFASSNEGSHPDATPVVNSVILCDPGVTVDHAAFNSVFLEKANCVTTYRTNCLTVTTADGLFDDDGVPVPGSACPALGLADAARYDFAGLGWTDLAGRPRFSNNAMDAGAFQSDWRPWYARRLGGSSMVCTAAATNVHEVADGVRLETGAITLTPKQPTRAAGLRAEVAATVDGTGMLKLLNGDEVIAEWTAADSPVATRIALTTGGEQLTFVYEPGTDDSGSATVQTCRIPRGIVMSVR